MRGLAFTVAAAMVIQATDQHAALVTMRDAVNRGDARGYASVYSPSSTITIFGTGELKGRAAIEQHEVDLLKQFPKARFEFFEVWHSGRQAVAHYGVNAPTAANKSMGHEGLLFFTFNAAGEIERERRYLDSLTPMAQLGALGNAPSRPLPALTADWRSHHSGDAAEPRNIAAARRLFSALDGRRRDEVAGLFTASPTIDEVMLVDVFDGAQGAGRWLDVVGALSDGAYDITTIIGAGRGVLVEGVWQARVSRPFGLIKPSPQRLSIHRAAILEFDASGRISRLKAFMNGKELAEAAGQWPIP
jgi:hypothetical protein